MGQSKGILRARGDVGQENRNPSRTCGCVVAWSQQKAERAGEVIEGRRDEEGEEMTSKAEEERGRMGLGARSETS